MSVTATAIEEFQKLSGWIAGGAGAAILAWYRLRRVTANDNKIAQSEDATASVIVLLRAEVERLSAQNKQLAMLVHSLQLQVIRLQQENTCIIDDVTRIKDARKTD